MISYSNVWGPNLPLSRKAATKVVGARSDQGLKCTDKDQSKETVDQALISAFTFCRDNNSPTKTETCFLCESLALQDYSN